MGLLLVTLDLLYQGARHLKRQWNWFEDKVERMLINQCEDNDDDVAQFDEHS